MFSFTVGSANVISDILSQNVQVFDVTIIIRGLPSRFACNIAFVSSPAIKTT